MLSRVGSWLSFNHKSRRHCKLSRPSTSVTLLFDTSSTLRLTTLSKPCTSQVLPGHTSMVISSMLAILSAEHACLLMHEVAAVCRPSFVQHIHWKHTSSFEMPLWLR